MTQLPLFFEQERSKTVEAVRQILTGRWLPPHLIHAALKAMGIHISAEAVTARCRDLRKKEYGGFKVVKRWNGTHYDYSIQ